MSITRDVTLKAYAYLDTEEIVLFVGARQAGKTTVLKQIDAYLRARNQTTHFLNLEDPDYLTLLNASPKNLLKILPFDFKQRTVVLIDEVQYLANPSHFLKYFYDEYKGVIKIIASGSSAFYIDQKFKDSLAGRKIIFNVFTLSFRELLKFKGENELQTKDFWHLSLSEKEKIISYYEEYLIYGGYPRVALAPLHQKKEVLQELAYSYIKKDLFDAQIRQDDIFYKLFKILSSQIGNLVNASELASTVGLSKTAIDHYLRVMQKSFHIKLIHPFFQNIRKELTKMPKIYFLDTGLRNFFADNFRQFMVRQDKGMLLENAVFRQLLEIHDESEIKFWRTINKHELDFVVGEKEVFEVKLNPMQFNKKNYQMFLEAYPDISLKIVSFEQSYNTLDTHGVIQAWQV